MLVSLVHTWFEVLIILAVTRLIQMWLIQRNPEGTPALALSFIMGS